MAVKVQLEQTEAKVQLEQTERMAVKVLLDQQVAKVPQAQAQQSMPPQSQLVHFIQYLWLVLGQIKLPACGPLPQHSASMLLPMCSQSQQPQRNMPTWQNATQPIPTTNQAQLWYLVVPMKSLSAILLAILP